jgi:hypothetical protein
VVIVQDIFNGSNFSHFFFDWIPRLGHFLTHFAFLRKSSLFLMGGIRGPFHELVIGVLCEIFGIERRQLVFPGSPQVWHISGPVFFFSDQKDSVMHPANMVHEASLGILDQICRRVITHTANKRKVYISRSDARFRRIANEQELVTSLEDQGFAKLSLAEMSVHDQIAAVRGADLIVAPHGMGLTHIAFHPGAPRIVELHNGAIGTDAYRFVAAAKGFPYRAVFGDHVGNLQNDFRVSIEAVLESIDAVTDEPLASTCYKQFELSFEGAEASWHHGVQSLPAAPTSSLRGPDGRYVVMRHVLDGPTRTADNNVGWLQVSGLKKGATYSVGCRLWVPFDFKGHGIELETADLTSQRVTPADMLLRDQWQTVWISGQAVRKSGNFVLRPKSMTSEVLYTNGWVAHEGTFAHGTHGLSR